MNMTVLRAVVAGDGVVCAGTVPRKRDGSGLGYFFATGESLRDKID